MLSKPLTHDDYTVGWICPLEVEQIAAIAMLDEQHPSLHQSLTDSNSYTLGSIQGHNVVIAGLPTPGNNSAATVVAYMRSTFANLRFNLLVGIGGGVPIRTPEGGAIKLGHVVVSKPTGQHSGAVQYDHGRAEAGEFRRTGSLAPPPNALLNAAQKVAVTRASSVRDPLQTHLNRIDTTLRELRRYKCPGSDKDHLYQPDYVHADRRLSCHECGCDSSKRVEQRAGNDEDEDSDIDEHWLTVHRGTIASGELVMRNGLQRDVLAQQYEVLCFDKEAAGALNDFPCLVIRGISDYADSHKNDKWQGYAASVAAAYARELFTFLPHHKAEPTSNILEGDYDAALRDAVLEGRTGTVKELFNAYHDRFSSEADRFDSLLYSAAEKGYLDIAQLLIDNGANVNARGGYYGNPLQAASNGGYTKIVGLLLDRGAIVDARGGAHSTALNAAAVTGHSLIVKHLLEHGADANTPLSLLGHGKALHAASASGHTEIVNLLLESGANAKARDGPSGSALQAAVHAGHTQIVKLLLDKGADANIQGRRAFDNPITVASAGGHTQIVRLLLDNGATIGNLALLGAVYAGQVEIVKMLLDAGANALDPALDAGLGMASKAGKVETVALIRERRHTTLPER